ncbi:hypothetical protein [Streptomyces triticiradicis]|uniref:hypothetical protein n=1 Tax=Streptomyces triticiradicis TaxID=2651189 RepID=UPI001CED4EB1|nr:hypothetical protein [Streptomyces triticiradicis]
MASACTTSVARIDAACSVPVRQMADRDPQRQRDEPGQSETESHLVRRKVDRLGEVQHSGGQIEAGADGVDELRGREDALRPGIRNQARHGHDST